MLTNGAMFMAQVYHNAYQRAEEELGGHPVGNWDSLSSQSKKAMGLAFQMLFDLGVLTPFTLTDSRKLISDGLMHAPSARRDLDG